MHFVWKMNFVWKMILIQRPAEKAYYIWAPIQYPSCTFCVENDFENDILNQRSPEEPYYIRASKQFPSCAFCLKNDFESAINWGTMLHLSTKSIHNTSLSPSSSFTSGVSRSSLLSSPREFGSCKLCGKDFSIDSWLKMHIISKHQTNSQAPKQFTISLSLHFPRSLLRENSVPASCVVKIET